MQLSLLHQNLAFLSEGLEGRSDSPVAKLFDALLQPGTDLGMDLPSNIVWSYDQCQSVSHLVVGDQMPGGSWNGVPGHIETLSPVSWLQLPGYSVDEWKRSCMQEMETMKSEDCVWRIKAADVRQYYVDYIDKTGISNSLMSNMSVVSLRVLDSPQVYPENGCCGAIQQCTVYGVGTGCFCSQPGYPWEQEDTYLSPPTTLSIPGDYKFELIMKRQSNDMGHSLPAQQDIKVHAKHVVLAVGLGRPCHLGVQGEDLSFVFYRYPDDVQMLDEAASNDPILVVGSGLCAADVILMALARNCRVLHVFRRKVSDMQLKFNTLPAGAYPEYEKVRDLMHGTIIDRQYKAFECHTLQHISSERICTVVNNAGAIQKVKVSFAFVLIGSQSELGFLPTDLQKIGIKPSKPVSNANPADIDVITFEVCRQPGLYAIGPIVGDNFVRFGIGGALGVASNLIKSTTCK